MRVLLAHNSLYYPSHGGGDKSNRLLMSALAARGHTVRVVSRVQEFSESAQRQLMDELSARGVHAETSSDGAVRFVLDGVEVHSLALKAQLRAYFAAQIEAFDPDVIVTSTDDPAQLLFDVAVRARARVVFLVRATIALPFGPDASALSVERTENLRRADGVVGVSEYVAQYVREHSGIVAVHLPISLMEGGEPASIGKFENEFVTIVNPCAVKGISVFLEIARALPETGFAAVPTWGTTALEREQLVALPNVRVLPAADDIDDILRRTRVLLVPSLWAEARSRIVPEAMLRGIPVIASDVGGLNEAKLGVPYLLPVKRIKKYRTALDENLVPVADVPAQDVEPWVGAVQRLTTERDHWTEIAEQSRRVALEYARSLSVEPFERLLAKLAGAPKKQIDSGVKGKLSPERQRLLTLAMRSKVLRSTAKAKISEWFPLGSAPANDSVTLFCFPHAGGGTLLYRNWAGRLGTKCFVSPVLLPGRESRREDAFIDDLEQLVERLHTEMLRLSLRRFAFFGHSMGAVIAFELARALCRSSGPLPVSLHVSAARAPQFRENYTPPAEPDDAALLEQLRAMNSLPGAIARDDEALRLFLPVVRADARMYRNYRYLADAPLAIPIYGYGGDSDANVLPIHIDRWSEQTTAHFQSEQFPGGHFFLEESRSLLLVALARDLPLS